MFCRYVLRTTDVDAALPFYAETIGLVIPRGGAAESSATEAWPLHEQARARGAPAHWLGQLHTDDLDRTVARLVELGGERLGPTFRASDGTPFATLRDPFGSVIGIRPCGESPSSHPVRWHQLHTRDVGRAWTAYRELFGWAAKGIIDVADPEGGHRLFAWSGAGETAGSMANTARWPGVHTHWLFYFPVADVAAAVARVHALGGKAKDPIELPDGTCLAACEDPQGAAFGVIRRA
jgi:uncharacterized protein